MIVTKLVSGGQTGVDRGALEAAIESGFDYGGWVPKGRKCEDGPLEAAFDKMSEMTTVDYLKRTERNVVDSDATVVLCHGMPTGGTRRTVGFCQKHGRPCCIFDLDAGDPDDTPSSNLFDEVVYLAWLCRKDSIILNCAGPRESKSPGIQAEARRIFKYLIGYIRSFDGKLMPTKEAHLANREERERGVGSSLLTSNRDKI